MFNTTYLLVVRSILWFVLIYCIEQIQSFNNVNYWNFLIGMSGFKFLNVVRKKITATIPKGFREMWQNFRHIVKVHRKPWAFYYVKCADIYQTHLYRTLRAVWCCKLIRTLPGAWTLNRWQSCGQSNHWQLMLIRYNTQYSIPTYVNLS